MKNQSDTNLKLRKESIVKFSLDNFLGDLNIFQSRFPQCSIINY
jgi:hypothetical protein